MSSTTLFLLGMCVFALMLTGLVLTMIEFHRVTTRPDLLVGGQPRKVLDAERSAVSART